MELWQLPIHFSELDLIKLNIKALPVPINAASRAA